MTADDGPGIGDLIDGRFRIERLLGVGGYGAVVGARDAASGRQVALKLIPTPTDSRDRRRWGLEVAAMHALDHPNLSKLVASGRHEGSIAYVAMELVEGPTLASVLADGRAIEVGVALAITRDLLAGLDAIHSAGIVHRDVKPANIILATTAEGLRAILVDFGIALSAKAESSWSRLTRSGTFVGTIRYLAPERIEGARGDPRSDVWSVGVVLFEMLTGRPPFRAKNAPRTMLQILGSAPPELPPEMEHRELLATIVGTALRKSAEQRFPSARRLDDALARLPIARATSLATTTWRPSFVQHATAEDVVAPATRTST